MRHERNSYTLLGTERYINNLPPYLYGFYVYYGDILIILDFK